MRATFHRLLASSLRRLVARAVADEVRARGTARATLPAALAPLDARLSAVAGRLESLQRRAGDALPPGAASPVADVLRRPGGAAALAAWGLACQDCPVADDERLEEVAAAHGLPLPDLLADLARLPPAP